MSNTSALERPIAESDIEDYELGRISVENDPQTLIAELSECMAITVKTIVKIGAIIRRLEALEFDIESLKLPNINYFRRVAHGNMIPELFVSLVGAPMVLRKVSNLPIPDQQRIASGKPVKVILRGGDHMLIRVDDLTSEQARQVFASDHIRSDSQQAAWLAERSQNVTSAVSASIVMIDRKRHGIVVGDTFISATDLAGYLGSLAEK
jgi:hypothetical protein